MSHGQPDGVASTISRIAEYGTLEALGMGNVQLARIVLEQAWILGFISYGLGTVLGIGLAVSLRSTNLMIDTHAWMICVLLLVTLATCTLASITSVAKVFRVPPAIEFKS